MQKPVSWMIIVLAVGCSLAFRGQEPTPMQYLAEIEIFEASSDFSYKVTGSRIMHRGDHFTSVGSVGDVDSSFRKSPLPEGLKRIAAPKVRTLEGMEATVYSGDKEGRNGLELKLVPRGRGKDLTQLDIRAQARANGKPIWKIAETPELGIRDCVILEIRTSASDGKRVRTILIARVQPYSDR